MSGQSVEISAIVPVRNGARTLPALLHSLNGQTLPRERYEVIVVDNASSDETSRIGRALGAIVVHEPVANRSRARNRGAAAAQSPLYAFTDADCVADPHWLEQLVSSAHRAPLVAGEVRLRVSQRPNAIERYEAMWRFGQKAWVEHQGWAATANLLVRADAFAAVRGFDPSWHHIGEDVDFCFRARARGFDLVYCPDAIVEHDGDCQLGALLARSLRHGYSVNQVYYRLGAGYRAWRRPGPAVFGDQALRDSGHAPERFDSREWRKMARLARAAYAARVAGSVWAEVRRAR